MLGEIIARKLKEAGARPDRTEVWIPRRGVSALSVEGAPFADAEADEALFSALRKGLAKPADGGGSIRVLEREEDINNSNFVEAVVDSLIRMMELSITKRV